MRRKNTQARIIGLGDAARRFMAEHLRTPTRRLHMSGNDDFSLDKFRGGAEQKVDYKPNGLWYGFGDSWIDWCLSEMGEWICPFIYEIKLRPKRACKITNVKQFEKFEQEYRGIPEWQRVLDRFPLTFSSAGQLPDPARMNFHHYIDYPRLAESYGALEIVPYLWSKRLNAMWYYGWDCASGCVWEKEAIKSIQLFAYYDEKAKEFKANSLSR